MGWTTNYDGIGTMKPAEFLKQKFSCIDPDDANVKHTVLDVRLKGGIAYMAIETADMQNKTVEVQAVVVLMKRGKKGSKEFSYKSMPEWHGPMVCECPAQILALLTDSKNDYSRNWRQRCRANLLLAMKSKPYVVDTIDKQDDSAVMENLHKTYKNKTSEVC